MTFVNLIQWWLNEELDEDDYQSQLAYITRVTKPTKLNDKTFNVNQFYQRIQVILKRMTYLPGAPANPAEIMGPRQPTPPSFTP
jgi:hypothetical protein